MKTNDWREIHTLDLLIYGIQNDINILQIVRPYNLYNNHSKI